MPDSHPNVKHPSFFLKEKQGIDKFNRTLAVSLGKVLGSVYFFYFCVLLDLFELPSVIQAHSVISWVSYVSSVVIQLLALPILQTYQNIQQESKDASDEANHMALTHIATTMDSINEKLK